jgi:hypothetical protein
MEEKKDRDERWMIHLDIEIEELESRILPAITSG